VRNKTEVIADFTAHTLTYQSITTADVRVRVYGNTAVETGRSTMVGQDRGKAVPRENRFTRVWVMAGGTWQLVANHYSPMTPK
jgi:ketosteroid isomerase-like protein